MFIERMVQVTTRVSRVIALAGPAGLLILAIAAVLDMLLRWLLNKPIVGI